MAEISPGRITVLLRAWKEDGNTSARDELFKLVEADLKGIARQMLRRMGHFEHKLQPTELVNELYLKLGDYDVIWKNRHLFFGMVGSVVRNILLDIARRDDAAKRPPSVMRVEMDDTEPMSRDAPDYEVVDFYRSLDRLRLLNARHADTLELHGIFGLTLDEVAQHHGVSPATTKRDFQAAKAWLRSQLRPSGSV
jgi:RNA polymerase sigma factor (TIGR02999 family)